MTVQTGCKPYQCLKCGQEFRRKVLLNKHKTENKCAVVEAPVALSNPSPSEPAGAVASQRASGIGCETCGKITESQLEALLHHIKLYK